MESKLKSYNEKFRRGQYREALAGYLKLKNECPDFYKIVDVNVRFCLRKIRQLDSSKITKRPQISIVTPVHNVEPYLEKCLASLLNQSLEEIEIILVDDGSTDNSFEIIKEYAKQDGRVKFVRNSTPSGNSGVPRNQGLKIASGEYIAFVDSDDWIDEEMMEHLYAKAIAEDADIVSCNSFYREHPDGKTELCELKNIIFEEGRNSKKELFLCPQFPIVWYRIYRRELIRKNTIEFGETSTSADLPFSYQALYFANKVATVESAYYHYRFDRPGSTIDRRKGKGAFDLIVSHSNVLSFIKSREGGGEYIPYAILKLLGDYQYNSKMLISDHKEEFGNEISKLIKRHHSEIADFSIFNQYWKKLYDSLLSRQFFSQKDDNRKKCKREAISFDYHPGL